MLIKVKSFSAMRANTSLRRIRRIKLRHLRHRIENSDIIKLKNYRALSYKPGYVDLEKSNTKKKNIYRRRHRSGLIRNERMKFDKDVSVISSCKDCDEKQGYFLLSCFVEYVCGEEKDECCFGCVAKKFANWLESVKLNLNDDSWHFSSTLDIRIRSKFELSNVNLDDIEQLNEHIFFASLAYSLKFILPILINSKDDVNFQDAKGQTILHIFLEQCRKNSENFDEVQKAQKLIKILIDKGALLFAIDKAGKMPFEIATQIKNSKIMQEIILCMNVHATDHHGNTALHLIIENCINEKAHKSESLNFVKILVSRNANVNFKNDEGIVPVHIAAKKFNLNILKFFKVVGADFNQQTQDGKTCLHVASKSTLKLEDSSKTTDTCTFLIDQGCKLDAIDNEGYSSLHYAAEFSSTEVIERLINLGAEVDFRSKPHLITPLFLASKADKIDNMKELVKAGANVNAEGVDGTTAIFMTVMRGSVESLIYLMSCGADLYRRENYRGFTLLHLAAAEELDNEKVAAENGQTKSDGSDKNTTKFQILIEKEFEIDDVGYCGVTPLHMALHNRNAEFVKILIQRGANANLQNKVVKWAAMHVAAIRKDINTLKYLVERGFNVNCRSEMDQMTPLHLALITSMPYGLGRDYNYLIKQESSMIMKFWPQESCAKNLPYESVVMFLIDNGADVNARDSSGRSPLYWATLQPFTRLTKKLLDSGAIVSVPDFNGHLPVDNVLNNGNADALLLLLEYGLDVNDNDFSQKIKRSNPLFKSIVVGHVIKLNFIGLPISEEYQTLVNLPGLENYRNLCSNEATSLRNHRDDRFSLNSFLHMKTNRQLHFVEQIVNDYENLKQLYPLYSTVIRAACREAINRKLIIDVATLAWQRVSKVYLPDLIVDHILSNLNSRCLQSLADTMIADEKTNNLPECSCALKGEYRLLFNDSLDQRQIHRYKIIR